MAAKAQKRRVRERSNSLANRSAGDANGDGGVCNFRGTIRSTGNSKTTKNNLTNSDLHTEGEGEANNKQKNSKAFKRSWDD